jgi:hypothetical protein
MLSERRPQFRNDGFSSTMSFGLMHLEQSSRIWSSGRRGHGTNFLLGTVVESHYGKSCVCRMAYFR